MKRFIENQTGLKFLVIFTSIFVLFIAIYYRQQPILEFHGFRQAQTALTSYWMIREGWRLDYQTPVAGYSWAIPFEFPIYQSIVALIANVAGFPLDPTGRFVSLFFLFASALPAFGITKRLKLPEETPWVFSALLWTSPLYMFWGRTFMIETTALFFTFAAIPYAIDLLEERPKWSSALWFMFLMMLGILQKITTAFPVLVVLSMVIAIAHFRKFGLRLPKWQKIIQVLVAFAIPVFIGGLWSYYTDIVKSQNILGMEMTSRMLTTWNFGTLQQRFDLDVFKTIVLDRVFSRNLGGILGILVLGASLIVGQPRIRVILFVSLALFLLPIEMFINVHFVHDYYQTSSALFAIGGFAIAIVDLAGKFTRNRIFVIQVVAFALVALNLFIYKLAYWVFVDNLNVSENQTLLVSSVLKEYTPADSVIVIFGMDWNSEIAYYSERKAFAVPRWEERDWPGNSKWAETYQKIWQDPEPYLGERRLGAIAFCEGGDSQFSMEKILENRFVQLQPRLFKISDCHLWLPNVESISLPGSEQVILPEDL